MPLINGCVSTRIKDFLKLLLLLLGHLGRRCLATSRFISCTLNVKKELKIMLYKEHTKITKLPRQEQKAAKTIDYEIMLVALVISMSSENSFY